MDAAVEFLLNNLSQLVSNHINLIEGANDEFKLLQSELIKFQAILVDASKKYKKDETFKVWESEIREAVYDIEDVIDTCITKIVAGKANKTNWFKKVFSGTYRNLAEEVKDLRANKVKPLLENHDWTKFSIADVDDDSAAEAASRIRKQKSQHIVGFEEEAETFIDLLSRESNQMEILSVIGMAGLGKTTFAYKIFEAERINFEFPVRIWVNISDNLNVRNVLLAILQHFPDVQRDESVSEEQLIDTVKGKLQEGKFFIVMDDIWTTAAWKTICSILPENNRFGRILITTRSKIVADYACTEKAHHLRFLDQRESWELLQHEVYNKLDVVPKELVDVGRAIATDCDGLPLSIVIIGGILMEKRSRLGDNIDKIKTEWSEISDSVKNFLTKGTVNILASIISLSYQKLPYELRNCFLYLGVFPEDAHIPVKKLIRLWIAEGFIKESGGDKSLEEVAHEKLEELINLNLVMVRKAKPNGEPKICHMHDSIREICIIEGSYKKLNLFQEISKSKQGSFEPHENIEKFRRLCIHSYVLPFFSIGKQFPITRSFMCFSESVAKIKAEEMAFVNSFGLLRVYDAKNLLFPKFPSKIMQLLHLRYLTLVLDKCECLPDISILWNLQTLIVGVPSQVLKMKSGIWKMRQLRHFQTKSSISLGTDRKPADGGGENLQTIGRLSPDSCTKEFFSKAKNLTCLGIKGDLNQLVMSSDSSGKLNRLNKLKLVHEHSAVAAENPWVKLPEHPRCFPTNLKTLVLITTNLNWTEMSVLSNIPYLEVLKLKQNAFKGNPWEAKGVGFHHLIRLHIERATELKSWTVLGDPFPTLKYLYISNCERLVGIPSALGNKLELLHIERAQYAISSANQIVADQKKQGRVVKLHIAATDMTHDS